MRKYFFLFLLVTICSCIGNKPEVNPKYYPETKNSEQPRRMMIKPKIQGETQVGMASWYGLDEHDQKAASGERFDKNDFTAAHKTLPMDSIVMVTNLENGKDVVVRINDRGPFVKDRIIDLSYAAAKQIGMLGPGTASVKVEVISTPNRNDNYFEPKYVVQVGSFRDENNANKLKEKLSHDFDNINIQEFELKSEKYFRVRLFGYNTRQEAQDESDKLRKLGYKPSIKLE